MKIYTRTGDQGSTGLFAGPRVDKDHPRIEAYGAVDELNAALGLARSAAQAAEIDRLLAGVQHQLFSLGAELATPEASRMATPPLGSAEIVALEDAIDRFESGLAPLAQFILPAGGTTSTTLQLARAICRRAERRLVTLRRRDASVSEKLLIYLNRLGDLLFVLSRSAALAAGQRDVPWEKPNGGGA